jgi:hypothetical protein
MLDRLHGAPLTDFVTLRKSLAAELKERGDKKAAEALLAEKKPPITAWALNQVALHHHAEIEAFLAATEKLRAAQQAALAGDEASDFRESGRELQRQLNAVVTLAKKALESAGHQATTIQLRRIGQSLHSTAFAAPSDLARLAAGHLEADLDVPVDFGVFAAPEEGVRRLAEEDEEAAAAKPEKHAKKKPTKPAAKEPDREPAEQREAARQRAAAEAQAKKEEEKRAAENRAHHARELREARAEATALAKKAEAASKRATLLDKAAKIHERKATSARQAADHAAEAARIAEAAASAAATRASSLRD